MYLEEEEEGSAVVGKSSTECWNSSSILSSVSRRWGGTDDDIQRIQCQIQLLVAAAAASPSEWIIAFSFSHPVLHYYQLRTCFFRDDSSIATGGQQQQLSVTSAYSMLKRPRPENRLLFLCWFAILFLFFKSSRPGGPWIDNFRLAGRTKSKRRGWMKVEKKKKKKKSTSSRSIHCQQLARLDGIRKDRFRGRLAFFLHWKQMAEA